MKGSHDRKVDWTNLPTSMLLRTAACYGLFVGISYGLTQLALDRRAGPGHALELGLVLGVLMGCLATLVLLGSRRLARRGDVSDSSVRRPRRF
jgi:hypothetical protein